MGVNAVKRLKGIDILKCIGLLGIIMAHVSPPGWMMQLRNFDVPLMIIVSVYLYFYKHKTEKSYLAYAWKRFKRLVFPTYLFLVLFFMASRII